MSPSRGCRAESEGVGHGIDHGQNVVVVYVEERSRWKRMRLGKGSGITNIKTQTGREQGLQQKRRGKGRGGGPRQWQRRGHGAHKGTGHEKESSRGSA